MHVPLKCLSLYQPWSSDVAEGRKLVETRGWSTQYRGLLAIHAGKNREYVPRWSDLPRGAIVAVTKLYGVRPVEAIRDTLSEQELHLGDYSDGRYGWLFTKTVKLTEPIPTRGFQKLFSLPDPIAEQLASEWEAAWAA